ncbi:MAG: rod shape-determining protein MreD [Candidatus Auribacterota bacterium]|jgi:rod shape-determining protein MreD|nr:rod shape-determining protein MreD [Candidatus Auribacterota bacterium]
MIVRPNYYSQYRFKKKVVRSSLLLYLLMYFFAGLQANIQFTFLGYTNIVNFLLILAIFLIIEFDWNEVRWYCLVIGIVLDVFTFSQFGLSAIALWAIGYTISRIKKGFYIEYISTAMFLLFILILGYCFIFCMWNYIANRIPVFVEFYTQMVLSNSPVTLLVVPVIYPLLKVLLHGKNS